MKKICRSLHGCPQSLQGKTNETDVQVDIQQVCICFRQTLCSLALCVCSVLDQKVPSYTTFTNVQRKVFHRQKGGKLPEKMQINADHRAISVPVISRRGSREIKADIQTMIGLNLDCRIKQTFGLPGHAVCARNAELRGTGSESPGEINIMNDLLGCSLLVLIYSSSASSRAFCRISKIYRLSH